jgi:hypothetical protein
MKKMLLGFILCAALPFGTQAADSATLEAIKKSGGLVLPYPGEGEQWEVEFHLRGRDLTDDGLANVAALKNVIALNLRDTQITSAGLVHLKGLTKLRRLHLERTKIGDEGIGNLVNLPDLEYLNLYATKITDKSLDQLAGLKNLKQLYVWQTEVTDEGVARFKKARPKVKIVRGLDLSKVVVIKKPEPKPMDTLKWIAASDQKPPKSKPGSFTTVVFENKSGRKVKLYWVEYGGGLKIYGTLDVGATREQNTFSDATWLITDEKDKPLGYFISTPKLSKAVIPKVK